MAQSVNIAFFNESGSAGKTTEAVNLAVALALRGQRVRYIGLDPQGDGEWYLGIDSGQQKVGLGRALVEREILTEDGDTAWGVDTLTEIEIPVGVHTTDSSIATGLSRLTVVPAGPDLEHRTIDLDRDSFGANRLFDAISADDDEHGRDVAGEIDIINILDGAGSKTILTVNALAAAHKIITCAHPDWKPVRKLPQIQASIEQVARAQRRQLSINAIIPCKVPSGTSRGKFFADRMDDLRGEHSQWAPLVTPAVRESVVVPESFWAQQPLRLYAPGYDVTKDQDAVLAWLDERRITT